MVLGSKDLGRTSTRVYDVLWRNTVFLTKEANFLEDLTKFLGSDTIYLYSQLLHATETEIRNIETAVLLCRCYLLPSINV